MATLADMRARCRLMLASTADWPDASLDAWIGDAIRFYSVEFPRRFRHRSDAGDRDAGLRRCRRIARSWWAVEYPTGEVPVRRSWCRRTSRSTRRRFRRAGGLCVRGLRRRGAATDTPRSS